MKIKQFGNFKFKVRDCPFDTSILTEEINPSYYNIPENIKVVVDIGAHIGGTSVLCASKGAEVYAYEPSKENYDLLIENVQLNNVKVNCINKAVGIPGIRTLSTFVHNTGLGTLTDKESPMKEVVEVVSIQEVFKNIDHCDLLKIDCEGGEYEFLKDAPFYKIDNISMELHAGNKNDMIELLQKYYIVEYNPAIDGTSLMVTCSKKITADIWDYRYDQGYTSWICNYDPAADFIVEQIEKFIANPNEIKSVMDVGCGDLNFAKKFMKLFSHSLYLGIDISEVIIYHNLKKLTPDNWYFRLINNSIFDHKADVVICLNTLYHIIEDKEYYNMLTSLRKSWINYLIIATYNESQLDIPVDEHIKKRIFDPTFFSNLWKEIVIPFENGSVSLYLFRR